MKTLILVSLFIASVTSASVLSGSENDLSALTCQYIPTDIIYQFYSLQNPKESQSINITSNRPDLVKKTHFSKSKETILLVHGSGTPVPLIQKVRQAIVDAKIDINIIGVNWQMFQKTNRAINVHNCSKMFGNIVGGFLKDMVKNNGLTFDKLTIVGHSIAGGFCGDIGLSIDSQAKTIYGLETCSRKNTAKFTQCLHTGNPNYTAMAHANYYPNGAIHQPGCPDPDLAWCGHWRVIDLFAESLASNKFVGRECPTYADYKAGKCNKNAIGIMGGLHPDTKMQGRFYLDTNAAPPYAKG